MQGKENLAGFQGQVQSPNMKTQLENRLHVCGILPTLLPLQSVVAIAIPLSIGSLYCGQKQKPAVYLK